MDQGNTHSLMKALRLSYSKNGEILFGGQGYVGTCSKPLFIRFGNPVGEKSADPAADVGVLTVDRKGRPTQQFQFVIHFKSQSLKKSNGSVGMICPHVEIDSVKSSCRLFVDLSPYA